MNFYFISSKVFSSSKIWFIMFKKQKLRKSTNDGEIEYIVALQVTIDKHNIESLIKLNTQSIFFLIMLFSKINFITTFSNFYFLIFSTNLFLFFYVYCYSKRYSIIQDIIWKIWILKYKVINIQRHLKLGQIN